MAVRRGWQSARPRCCPTLSHRRAREGWAVLLTGVPTNRHLSRLEITYPFSARARATKLAGALVASKLDSAPPLLHHELLLVPVSRIGSMACARQGQGQGSLWEVVGLKSAAPPFSLSYRSASHLSSTEECHWCFNGGREWQRELWN